MSKRRSRPKARKTPPPPSKTVLDIAFETTDLIREVEYGHPLYAWGRIGRMQQMLLDHAGGNITPQLAQLMQICVKLVRLAKDPHHKDSLVDVAGYARNIERSNDEIARATNDVIAASKRK